MELIVNYGCTTLMNNRKEFQYNTILQYNIIQNFCHFSFSYTGVDRLTEVWTHQHYSNQGNIAVGCGNPSIGQHESESDAQNMLFMVQDGHKQGDARTNTFTKKGNKTLTSAGISWQSLPDRQLYRMLSLLTTNKVTSPSCFPFCLISCTQSFPRCAGTEPSQCVLI